MQEEDAEGVDPRIARARARARLRRRQVPDVHIGDGPTLRVPTSWNRVDGSDVYVYVKTRAAGRDVGASARDAGMAPPRLLCSALLGEADAGGSGRHDHSQPVQIDVHHTSCHAGRSGHARSVLTQQERAHGR